MSSFSERYNKRHGIGGAVVGIIVIVVIIVSALAGYYAAASSISASTSTEFQTSTLTSPPVTNTVTNTATTTLTNTVVESSGTTITITGTPTTVTSTSISTSVSTSVSTSTQVDTTTSCPPLPSFGSSSLPSLSTPISEAGSSLLFPLFQLWATNFTHDYSNVQVNTAAGGSGAGQTGVEQNTINIGGSDPFLSNAQVNQYPNILNIAVAVSAQQVNYNLPGLPSGTHLNFTGNVLAGIYNGTITSWNNAAIKALQSPSIAALLPNQLIIPLHRSDSSGDTNLFTTYLSDTSPDWAKNIGAGNTVAWPSVPTAQAENGNSGMLQAASQTQYSIAYIGVSYLAQANTAGLGNAALQNLAGKFVQLTTPNIESALNAQYSSTPANERISLIYGPGATSYPIVNFEYALVNANQPSQALATDISALLTYATSPQYGNSAYFLNQVGFVALPPSVAQLTCGQIAQITG